MVVERSFADAFGLRAGDLVTLNGRSFRVAGVAVTAALPTDGIGLLEGNPQWPNPGLVWLTEADASSLAILAGGRVAEQLRRVGLLKAVGGTPELVAGVLLAEYLALALVAAAIGLAAGRLLAPVLTSPGAGLLGTAGAPQLSAATVGIVASAAVAVAALATVAVFITRATVADARHTAAVTRALGATPRQLTVGLAAAQVRPALAGAVVGVPGGLGLFTIASQGGSASQPPAWWLICAVLGTVIAVAGLTAIPARAGARRPVAETLRVGTA